MSRYGILSSCACNCYSLLDLCPDVLGPIGNSFFVLLINLLCIVNGFCGLLLCGNFKASMKNLKDCQWSIHVSSCFVIDSNIIFFYTSP